MHGKRSQFGVRDDWQVTIRYNDADLNILTVSVVEAVNWVNWIVFGLGCQGVAKFNWRRSQDD